MPSSDCMLKGECVMRIQKINDSTLRICLSLNELAERNITMVELFQRTAKTEQLFWEMITKAGEEVEFVLDQPFWIQATVMSGEEFVITVVKQDFTENQTEEPKAKSKRKPRNKEWVYRIADLEQVVNLTKSLGDTTPGKVSLFFCAENYYIVINNRSITGVARQRVEALLKEYGEKVNVTRAYLEEYGKLIGGKEALEGIRQYF